MGTEENAIIAPAGTEASATSTEPQVITPAPVVTEGDPATPAVPASTTTPVVEPVVPVKEPSAAEKRIAQLVAKQRESERQTEYWKGVAEGRKAPVAPEPEVTPAKTGPPKVESFEVYDDFLVAKAKYELRQELQAEKAQEEKTRETKTAQEADKAFMDRMEKAAENDPDLLVEFRDPSLPVSPHMAAVIKESDVAPKIIRYLLDNRAESTRISQLAPLAAARAIGKLEEKITSAPTRPTPQKTVSQAPEPIQTLDTKGKTVVDLDNLPIDEFMRRRNSAQFGRKG